jgi:hypothetical protein
MNMKRFLTGAVVLGLTAMPALAGQTITPLQGTIGNPFNNGQVHGFGWNGVQGGGAGPLIGNLYDNILTINGGAATAGAFGPFQSLPGTQAFVDWTGTAAQWTDDLHGLAGGAGSGGPTAVITSIRYGYSNSLGTTTHTILLYDMVPPSAGNSVIGHPVLATGQFGGLAGSAVVTGLPTGTAIVTVTGLSITMGPAAWIKFGESGVGFPGTFWMSGGVANGNGTSHNGLVYSNKNYYGPGIPLHQFVYLPYFYFAGTGAVGANIQVALGGFTLPAPAAISLLGLGGLVTLRRRRSR